VLVALHPLIRLDLGLDLYWKSIRLRPTSVPEETSLDTILFRPIQCNKDQSLPVFRRPNLKPSRETGATHAPSLPITHEQLGIPLHSVVPLSLFTSAGNQIESTQKVKFDYFRVISKTDVETDEISRPLGSIVVLDHDERMLLWELRNDSCQDGKAEVLHQSELDDLVNSLSKPVVSSTIWADGILSDLSRNSRMMVILCGPTGSGKTFSSLLLCAMARLKQHKATLYFDCKLLQESTSRLDEILNELDSIFEYAVKAKECVVVLDELDRLAPNLLGGDENDPSVRVQSANPIAVSQSKVIADRFLQLIEATSASGVSMVITCPNVESINTSLHRSAQIFQTQVDVPVLSARDRLSVLRQMVNQLVPDTSSWDSNTIGQRTEGFRPRDLEKIASRAHQMLRSKHNAVSVVDALEHVLNEYTPISHLSLSQNEKVVSPTWPNIGGLFKVKSKLESTILHPVIYKLIYEQASIRLPRGILLFGPPGCGKSALVPALAQACNFPLISCKGPEVLDKYIGASEAKIRELFKRASDVAPSIIFLDELDALAPRRGSDHTGVTDRVVNQLLTFLDGVEDISKSTVFVIGATSRPDKIDNALLRPGRLEQHLYVGPPNTEDELNDLFTKLVKNWNLSADCRNSISSKAQVQDMLRHVSGSHRFSPADLKAALETAHVNAVHRHLESAKPEEIEQIEISKQDLTLALRATRPSLNPDDSRDLENIYRAFKGEVKGSFHSETKLKTTLK
jgi:SpoVK/Ycf46/Vps4 family AAA+-type ATPase